MKSTTEIVDILYSIINGSSLHNECKARGGIIYTDDSRVANSGTEDITIYVLDDLVGGDSQEFVVNVNVYVPDVQNIIDKPRVRQLSRLAIDLFEEFVVSDYQFSLQSQPVMRQEGTTEHCINNKLILTHLK